MLRETHLSRISSPNLVSCMKIKRSNDTFVFTYFYFTLSRR
ncbi:unnamed protein product [Acanthoscelides obtectus]|uniref:Uncharacterized protein n=1 Tax=Acanthoscelides obtectus TaxID=200917 RepID=A0A9P0P618_ACAOB|nr:unnamed protein product [Acanthoscelides obtectus]